MHSLNVSRPRTPTAIVDISLPLVVTAFFEYTSSYDFNLAQAVAAFLLCWIPWVAYRNWLRGERQNVPLFAFLGALFWLAYAVPLFWSKHELSTYFGRRVLTEAAITESLYLAVVSVVCVWLGMRAAATLHWFPRIGADVSDSPNRWNYLRLVFICGTLVRIVVPITAFGAGGRQIVSNFENTVPVVGFAIFVRYYLRGKLLEFDKLLIFGYVFVALVLGFASGWLGSFVSIGVVCLVVYSYERRRFPVMAAFFVLPVILFFQPAKEAFRGRYWQGNSTDTAVQRVGFWVENSWKLWSEALAEQNGQKAEELATASLSRISLLQQTANVIEVTPNKVPYQHGSLYSYIAVTFVPRFLWPNKPSVNDANHWYQVEYGLTPRKQLSSVSISVGTAAESYINFGWFGPVLIMIPLGVFLGSFERIFLQADSGLLFSSLGAVLIPQLLGIESQMAEYVAGLVQQISLVLLVVIPTLESRAKQEVSLAHATATSTKASISMWCGDRYSRKLTPGDPPA